MAGEVALGIILLVFAFIIRTFIVMLDNGTFDRIIIKLNNYIVSQNERLEREDI